MDKVAIKKMIAEIVESVQGCKVAELLVRIVERKVAGKIFDEDFDCPVLIQEMIAEGMLVEVEYIIPNMDYRIKSFLLPAGSKYGPSLNLP